ncbi:MAG: hypothetical protein ACE5I1_28580, partial [bacterium]
RELARQTDKDPRLVELILPSIGFGLIYLYFGLLPSIILHFAFDVVWFALPLFVADTPGAWVNQVLVVALTFIPLLIVFVSRMRNGQWNQLSDAHYNRSWQPPVLEQPAAEPIATGAESVTINPLTRRIVLGAGVIGVVLWVMLSNFATHAPPIKIDRSEAMNQAQNALAERGIELSPPWKLLSAVDAPLNQNDRFIWQTAGDEVYANLIGSHLGPPYWRMRYVKFEGDMTDRAEEYELHVDGEGKVFRYQHTLPEARAGDSLSEGQARAIADSVIQATYRIDPATLKFISSEPSKREARQDWLFTFADTLSYSLSEGEARIAVQISGNEVTDAYRYIHVPEEWQRQERNSRTLPQIFQIGSVVMVVLLMLAGAILAIVSWSRKQFSVQAFVAIFALLFVLSIIGILNSWPALEMQFSTAQPYKNQAAIFVVGGLVVSLFIAAGVALVVGMAHFWHRETGTARRILSSLTGIALGCAAAGVLTAFGNLKPSLSPVWADYSSTAAFLPIVSAGFGPVTGFIMRTAILLLLVAGTNHFTKSWTKSQGIFVVVWLLLGIVFAGTTGVETVFSWLLSGLGTGIVLLLVYHFVLRFDLAMVPLTVAVLSIFNQAKHIASHAYPAA